MNKKENIDWSLVELSAEDLVKYIESDGFSEDKVSDYEWKVFEFVMDAIYGGQFFDLLNSKL